jgi:hypothetical protein
MDKKRLVTFVAPINLLLLAFLLSPLPAYAFKFGKTKQKKIDKKTKETLKRNANATGIVKKMIARDKNMSSDTLGIALAVDSPLRGPVLEMANLDPRTDQFKRLYSKNKGQRQRILAARNQARTMVKAYNRASGGRRNRDGGDNGNQAHSEVEAIAGVGTKGPIYQKLNFIPTRTQQYGPAPAGPRTQQYGPAPQLGQYGPAPGAYQKLSLVPRPTQQYGPAPALPPRSQYGPGPAYVGSQYGPGPPARDNGGYSKAPPPQYGPAPPPARDNGGYSKLPPPTYVPLPNNGGT